MLFPVLPVAGGVQMPENRVIEPLFKLLKCPPDVLLIRWWSFSIGVLSAKGGYPFGEGYGQVRVDQTVKKDADFVSKNSL